MIQVIKHRGWSLRQAMYPGSFDPITLGHVAIINEALLLFDQVVVAVAENTSKNSLYTVDRRLEMLNLVYRAHPNVIVDSYQGLTVDYAREKNIKTIVRGLRFNTDFEYEFSEKPPEYLIKSDKVSPFFISNFPGVLTPEEIITRFV